MDVLGEYFTDRRLASIFFHFTQIVQHIKSYIKFCQRPKKRKNVNEIFVRKTSALLITSQHFSIFVIESLLRKIIA